MFHPIDFKELVQKNKVLVLILSIVAFALGIMCFISPWYTGAALIWIMIGLAGLGGLLLILKFIFPGKGNSRNPSSIMIGIILLICVVAIVLLGIYAKDVTFKGETISGFEVTTLRLLCFGSIFFGVFSVINNISMLFMVGQVESGAKGWVIAKSIFGIIIGVLMCVFPFVMFAVSVVIGGIYLVISSVTMFIFTIKFWNPNK